MHLASYRRLVCLAAALLLPLAVHGSELMEDVDYRVIPKQRLSDTERIEVVYFFYYGCTWCYQFEPYIADWLKNKPTDVSFRRVPALRNSKWITLTRAFYTYEALDLLPRLHAKTFQAFHHDEVNLQSESTLFDWVEKQGVERKRFEEVFQSDAIATRTSNSRTLTNAFEVESTPSVVVDGRYLTSSGMTGGVGELMTTVEELIKMVREERRGAK
ncbi:MAG TPA: thiol:disulfide interchange protein DsbA/DsbL [Burkholderiales bacterium]|nr:thiol:disulfide interchange protein DsbA/DsbL [Burkholderiales bacterium]